MGLFKATADREWHKVQCFGCNKRETITVSANKLWEDPRFTNLSEYVCTDCRHDGVLRRRNAETETNVD